VGEHGSPQAAVKALLAKARTEDGATPVWDIGSQ